LESSLPGFAAGQGTRFFKELNVTLEISKVGAIALLVLVFAALAYDLKVRKIPNVVTFPAIIFGLGYNAFEGGLDGFLFGLYGFLAGAGVFFIPFLVGWVGGGDLKLLGAIGAIGGTAFVLNTVVFTALWGGVMALILIFYKKRFDVLKRFVFGLKLLIITGGNIGAVIPDRSELEQKPLVLPYGLAIYLGTLTAFFVKLNLPW
jgi:prepilin peptidase CpaA